jgi:hypothetical protein
VLLGCKDMDCRWIETIKLAKWATDRMVKIKNYQSTDLNSVDSKILERIKYL